MGVFCFILFISKNLTMTFLNKKSKICFYTSVVIILVFFIVKTGVIMGVFPLNQFTKIVEYVSFLLFVPLFATLMVEQFKKNIETNKQNFYTNYLNDVLVSLSHNHLFYEGKLQDGAKILTNEVSKVLKVDRCSIWLYNKKNTSLVCQQLYSKNEGLWSRGLEIFEKDFKEYFEALKENPVIIANDVFSHPATSCFTEKYTKPLGIVSMLDAPIIFRGEVIGVICIESFTSRVWDKVEVNFAEMLGSLFSFAFSVHEINLVKSELDEFEHFVDSSVLVSKTDKHGRITYVNKKFEEVSGWSLDEVKGKDHRIVNSGLHDKKFWSQMYKKVNNDEIWNDVVVNKNRQGNLYWVDTYIKADFDTETDKVKGYISIRQDITDIHKNLNELNKKNVYLEHAAKILRHDMHSGINTYIPRGISSLERRLSPEDIQRLKLESPLRLLKEGLKHTQKVYKGVYEFTNLVKTDTPLSKELFNLKAILNDFLSSTSYSSQVAIDFLPSIEVNESLFCTAIDNLIRNGIRYNDSNNKMVAIYMCDESTICVQDNGRGMTQEEFEILSQPYNRKTGQKETGTGLGLNICIAILNEHGFKVSCEKNEIGTKIMIKIR